MPSVTTTAYDMEWKPEGFPPVTLFDVTGDILLHTVHQPTLCKGEPCPFHNPSPHHMRDWTMTIDTLVVLRYCKHMRTHPDPDSREYARRNGLFHDPDHELNCCGCCTP